MAELVVMLNQFEFNSEYYVQKRGISMGTKSGPSYACLFVGHVEEMFHTTYEGPIPEFLIQYIDDVLGITTMSVPHCETYVREFNLFHPAIKLTHEISPISGVFLDLSLTVKGNAVSTSVYYKLTDSHSYLRYDSHHPDKCRDSIPYSQFLRLRRICCEDEDFAQRTEEMKDFFVQRGYPQRLLENSLKKVKLIKRCDTLHSNPLDRTSQKIPLVLTYNEVNVKIASIIRKNARILRDNDEVGHMFNNNILTSFKNDRNLAKHVIRSRLPEYEIPGMFPCG